MGWKIKFYSPDVMASIYQWPKGIKTKFLRTAELIEEFGPQDVGMPHIKPLGSGLFEIRAKGNEGIGRAPFCILKGQVIVILSEFVKKTQKTPLKEMDLARRRLKEIKKYDYAKKADA